jgi:hypothetical protein
MRTTTAFLLIIACAASPPAHAQHDSSHGGDRPHAHWHASPVAIRVAVALQPGGNVVFFRHGKTDMLATDQHPLVEMSDCSKQRNLSAAGIAASKEMGEAIKQLNIPIGQVLRQAPRTFAGGGTKSIAGRVLPKPCERLA